MRVLGRGTALCLAGLLALPLGTTLAAAPLRDSATRRGFFVGAAVNMTPFRGEPAYSQALAREFNMLVAENAMKFDAMHPAQTTYNFTDADALVNFAEQNGMAVRGHTLVWHSQIPGWLTNGNFTRDQTIAIMRDHIMTVVGRYRGRIAVWDVVNEAIDDGNGQLRTSSFWFQKIGADYVRMAFQFAREADPDAVLYYNDYSAEGAGTKSDGVFALVRDLVTQGAPIGGVGWQMHQINGFRIQQAHRTNAQRLADLGLELSITEMDVRIPTPTDGPKLATQALAYSDTTSFCLAASNCRALVTWGFTDKYSWVPGFFSGFDDALILDRNYLPKPAYTAMQTVLDGEVSPPSAPTNIIVVPGNGQVSLSWSASPGATSYNIKRSLTSGGPFATVGSTTATTFTNTGLTNGQQYFYVLSALNPSGESQNSVQVTAIPTAPSFTVALAPTSVSLPRGTSRTVAITLARTAGFTSSVACSLTGLPSGVSAAFSPASTTGTTITLTLTASLTAPLGTSTATLSCTGGSVTRTLQIPLTITDVPPSDLTLSANPTSVTVNRSATGTSTLTLTRTNLTAAVAFTATGLPSGVTAAFSPQSTTGNTSTLTFSASATATLGAAPVTVTAASGSVTRTTVISLTIASAPAGDGGVTLTPVVQANGPWFNEEQLRVSNTAPITALAITLTVQRTGGISFSNLYNTVGGQIAQANSSTATAITYQFTLAAGQTVGTGSGRIFAAQSSGTGTVHATAGDLYTVTYTTGGVQYTRSGHF